MLRNVLADYLSNISNEREFDLPLLTLLPAMGFRDVHFTHGQAEFGKDFIAKCNEDGIEVQYSFQSKIGDINQPVFRDSIMKQMMESILIGLSHPNFDRALQHEAVLITTGRLTGNAPVELQDLNTQLVQSYGKRPITLWDKEDLIRHLTDYGLEGVYRATALDFEDYGKFYVLYGRTLQESAAERDIEEHSRLWLDTSVEIHHRVLRATIEAEIIAQQCNLHGLLYEAMVAQLCNLRAIVHGLYTTTDPADMELLRDTYALAKPAVRAQCAGYILEMKQMWLDAGRDLVKAVSGPAGMITYLVHCARILELAGCLYFLEDETPKRQEVFSFLQEFLSREPGCAHIPSDRYAISLVLPVIALCLSGQSEDARKLIHSAVLWLCDRYEQGDGLASLADDSYSEIETLLGYPFDSIPRRSFRDSYLATVLSDLAAYLEDKQFFSDVVNDIKATVIFPGYWQAPDSEDLCRVDGASVITYPNIQYVDTLTSFQAFDFAEHIVHEPRTFRATQWLEPFSLMLIMLLLRDRHFPTVWPLLRSRST